ncbi:LysR family transcriptional regulator [Trinickia fusca]|uniref:LysR family transcriptional regulator n=1 Tax=Trinickia fusca TaxID=2419777 RepID=A0A494X9H0_9BURK|nr:LysR family transcriptional regulator [Trinickia fusca]RKP47407.1 LysR family transcriptional regulator [Trinickia fusca]
MQNVKFDRLRYLESVMTEGSIRKAAEKLAVPPSAVSRQIQTLEQETGLTLFERLATGVAPTGAAEHLLDYYRVCMAQWENLEHQLSALRDLQTGSVSLAVSEGLIGPLTEEILWHFHRRYPHVRISVQMKATAEIVEAVENGAVHIGLAYSPPHTERIRFHANAKHHVVAAVSPRHPLARQKGDITFGRAISYPFATMPAVYGLGRLIEAVAAAENLRFGPTFRANTLDMLKRFAIEGLGVSFVTDFSIMDEVAAGKLIGRRIDHPMLGNQYARVLVKADRLLSHAATELLQWIETRLSVFNPTADLGEAIC